MPRITMEQWMPKLEKLAEEIKLRWPWLRSSFFNNALHLEDRDVICNVSGAVGLTLSPRMQGELTYLVPEAQVTGGGGLTGSLSDIETGLRSYRAVVDALHFAISRIGNTEVYFDVLPCAHCGGSGEIRRSAVVGRKKTTESMKCPKCDGTGKQKPKAEDDAS